MQKLAKILFILISVLSGGPLKAAEKLPEYLTYVKEITNEFVTEMELKHNLHCSGSGGVMPYDVEKIKVLFASYKKMSIEEARKIEVDCVENLLKKINSHEKIRKYLHTYPFTFNQIGVSIFFRTAQDQYPTDGSLAMICLSKGKIHYDRAENVKEWSGGSIDGPKSTPEKTVYLSPPGYTTMDRLFPLHSETYEEALKIVQQDLPKKERFKNI